MTKGKFPILWILIWQYVVVSLQSNENFSNETRDILDEFSVNITQDCQFGGYAFHDRNAESVDQCIATCINHGMCNHFTWFQKMGHCALYYKDTIFEVERYLYSEKGRGDQCGFIGRFFQDDNFNNGFGIQDGCSYKNSEIKNENIQTADGCLDACLKDYSCTHFTWKATPTMCSLKHDNTKKDIDNSIEKDPGSKCGFVPTRFREIVDAYGIEIKDSCKFDEEQFDKFTTSSIDHCLNRCFQHSVCNHFMWDIGNRECYLYFSYLNHQVATNFQFQLGFKCGLIKKFIQEMDMNYDKKIKDNCNYKGMDIYKKGKYTSSAEKCKTICIENPTCTHFTWFGQPNNNGMTFCFLKKAATKRQIDKTIEKSSRNKCGLNEKILSV